MSAPGQLVYRGKRPTAEEPVGQKGCVADPPPAPVVEDVEPAPAEVLATETATAEGKPEVCA